MGYSVWYARMGGGLRQGAGGLGKRDDVGGYVHLHRRGGGLILIWIDFGFWVLGLDLDLGIWICIWGFAFGWDLGMQMG